MLNRIKYKRLPRTLRDRWSFEDFLHYRMQEMDIQQIEKLATEQELWEREKQLNSDAFRYIFNDKKEFYKRFKNATKNECIRREIIFLEDCEESEFRDFCLRHKRIVLKPKDMYAGIGVRVIVFDEKNSIDTSGVSVDTQNSHIEKTECEQLLAEFNTLKKAKMVAEEYVVQAKEYSDVYPLSLNTVRVATLVEDDGRARILFAVNQFGQKGSAVDNDDEAAIWAAIDTGSGIVVKAEVEAKDGRVYDRHPDTGVDIIGFQNPIWKDVSNLAIELAGIVPECRLIGWDIAVDQDYRIELIEGNVTPELDLYQNISGMGLKNEMGI